MKLMKIAPKKRKEKEKKKQKRQDIQILFFTLGNLKFLVIMKIAIKEWN